MNKKRLIAYDPGSIAIARLHRMRGIELHARINLVDKVGCPGCGAEPASWSALIGGPRDLIAWEFKCHNGWCRGKGVVCTDLDGNII